MNFCTICNKEFIDFKKHILEFHKPLPDSKNKGYILCKLCNIKVKDYYKHTFSALHRFNQDLNSIVFFHNVKDFMDHFSQLKDEKDIEDILKLNEENIFWITAKEELDEEQYKKLKEEIIGRKRSTDTRKLRTLRYKRFSRSSKSFRPNNKKVYK